MVSYLHVSGVELTVLRIGGHCRSHMSRVLSGFPDSSSFCVGCLSSFLEHLFLLIIPFYSWIPEVLSVIYIGVGSRSHDCGEGWVFSVRAHVLSDRIRVVYTSTVSHYVCVCPYCTLDSPAPDRVVAVTSSSNVSSMASASFLTNGLS